MKTLAIVLLNVFVSCCTALAVTLLVPARMPEVIRCERLEASESVNARQVITGYMMVRVPELSGDRGCVTINAGNRWAGINVTDGRDCESLWVEQRP